MGRIFTFGCSFTGYWYPTWADILIEEAAVKGMEGYNYGKSGAGNLYINLRIFEANAKFKFTKDDYVLVCWSGYNREDRWVKGKGWLTPGNLAHQHTYEKMFLQHYHDTRFCAMRDSALISSTQLALKQLGVNAVHFSIAPLIQNNEYLAFQTFEEQRDVVETYNLTLDAPSVMEHIGTLDQGSEAAANKRIKINYRNSDPMIEWHPIPSEHLDYINCHLKDKISWLSNGVSETGLKLVNHWTEKLTSYKGSVPIDTLGWRQKTPKDMW